MTGTPLHDVYPRLDALGVQVMWEAYKRSDHEVRLLILAALDRLIDQHDDLAHALEVERFRIHQETKG